MILQIVEIGLHNFKEYFKTNFRILKIDLNIPKCKQLQQEDDQGILESAN